MDWDGASYLAEFIGHTDLIGGESSEAGFKYLQKQMREGRDPIFDRPGTLEWDESFVENLGPMIGVVLGADPKN